MSSEEGAAALFTGVLPTIAGYGAEGALKFGAYESLKPVTAGALAALGLAAEQVASLGPLASAIVERRGVRGEGKRRQAGPGHARHRRRLLRRRAPSGG